MELEQNVHSLLFPPLPQNTSKPSIRNNAIYVAVLGISIDNAELSLKNREFTGELKPIRSSKRQREKDKRYKNQEEGKIASTVILAEECTRGKPPLQKRFYLMPEDYVSMRSILLDDPNYLDKYNLPEGKPSTC